MRFPPILALWSLLIWVLTFAVGQTEKKPVPPILEPGQTLKDLQKFLETRLPPLPKAESREGWEKEAERLRQEMFRKVIFRGEAAQWREGKVRVEWLETLAGGPGYRLKKLRFEAVPGLWIPALLYEPEKISGKVPTTLNVMGHDPGGKEVAYQQIRCINLVRRGMLALNVEWFYFGQLRSPENHHGCMNQLDLCGTSGLAPFYLALKRGLDVLLDHPYADPARVAVSGLSGGGWQTIYISSLDIRVTLANPVAGYSSFRTRLRHFQDLGDSEQTPCDMATVADYDHLTALLAPRASLLTYNAKDNCCFQSGYALPPLLEEASPFFQLYQRRQALRAHINHDPGTHNYDKENREAFYRMLGDHFFPGDKNYPVDEIPCEKEVRGKEELLVPLPAANATFNSLAQALGKSLPRQPKLPRDKAQATDWQNQERKKLAKLIGFQPYEVAAELVRKEAAQKVEMQSWRLRLGEDWTIPVIDLNPGGQQAVVLRLHDDGMATAQKDVVNQRTVLLDPFHFGETRAGLGARDYLWALFVSTVGERPLGVQVSQVIATARWLKKQNLGPITLRADGPRSSVVVLVAAALEPEALAGVEVHRSLGSLKEVIEQNRLFADTPELFCFGLLENFDLYHLAALSAPRPVRFVDPSPRVRQEMAELPRWYQNWGLDVDLLK
jgi:hypothetical protein